MPDKSIEALRTDFPERPIGRWKFNKSDMWFTSLLFGLLLLATHVGGKKLGLLVALCWLGLIMPTNYGKAYSIFIQRFRNRWMKSLYKEGDSGEVIIWKTDQRRLIPRPEPIGLTLHGVDELGFLHAKGRDTIVVTGQGSSIASKNIESQFDMNFALSDLIRKAAAQTHGRGHSVGWGWHFRARPLNMPVLTAGLENYIHSEVLRPQALDRPKSSWDDDDRRKVALGLNLQQLLEVTEVYTHEITMAAVCSVQREDFEKHLAGNQANRLPVVQLARTLPQELAALGVVDPHVLTPREMHAYLRGAWDVNNIDAYYKWLHESTDDEVLSSDNHLPQESITAGKGYLLVDGTYTTVLWLMDAPSMMYPHQLRQIFNIQVPWYSISLVGHTTSSKGEYAFLDRVISLTQEFENKAGVVHKGPKKQAQQDSLIDRQRKVFESSFGMEYNVLIAVHHFDRQGLEEAVYQVLQNLTLLNMTAIRVEEPIWQMPFALCASTAIDINML